MSDQCFWYFENTNLKPMMDSQKVKAVYDQMIHKDYGKGENIYLPEEVADKVYFIQEGRVKIGNLSTEGKEITKVILNEGEVFGELALVGDSKRNDFAVALEDTKVCIMTVEQMKQVMKTHNALSTLMMKIMGTRVLEMERRLESLVFKDSKTRVVDFLIELAEKKGQRVGYEILVPKFLTHQEIANLTATSRQTVTTVLNELRNKNILTFNRRRLLVRELDQLKAVSTL